MYIIVFTLKALYYLIDVIDYSLVFGRPWLMTHGSQFDGSWLKSADSDCFLTVLLVITGSVSVTLALCDIISVIVVIIVTVLIIIISLFQYLLDKLLIRIMPIRIILKQWICHGQQRPEWTIFMGIELHTASVKNGNQVRIITLHHNNGSPLLALLYYDHQLALKILDSLCYGTNKYNLSDWFMGQAY